MADDNIEQDDEINYKKDSLNNSRSNSVFLKSFDDGKFNYSEILNSKDNLVITFQNSSNPIKLLTKSIKKILSLIENEKENIESLYSQYVTAVVADENTLDKEDLLITDELTNGDDLAFSKILDQSKYFLISFPKNSEHVLMKEKLLNVDIFRNKIAIKPKTLKKIFQLLQKNIYIMYDLINIIILNMNNDISTFKSKILDKYLQTTPGENFMGVKNFDLNLETSEKLQKSDFKNTDILFYNVLSHLEEMFTRDYEKESEDGDNDVNFNIPKISIHEEIKKINNDELNEQRQMKCKCGNDVCTICSIY